MASALRYEWFDTLRREERLQLCKNRKILFSHNKDKLIDLLLNYQNIENNDMHMDDDDEDDDDGKRERYSIQYSKLTKNALLIELKAHAASNIDTKKTKIELLEEFEENYKRTGMTQKSLSVLKMSEIVILCKDRKLIIQNELGNKETTIRLLKEFEQKNGKIVFDKNKMSNKALSVELKARGLSYTGMTKAKMVSFLNSGIRYEEQKMRKMFKKMDGTNDIERVKGQLQKMIKYLKQNSHKLQNSNDPKKCDDWLYLKKYLENQRDNIKEIKEFVEHFVDNEFDDGGSVKTKNPIKKQNRSKHTSKHTKPDIEPEIEVNDDDLVYVVIRENSKMIFKQKQGVILGVYQNERDAENFRNDTQKRNKNYCAGIQEIAVNQWIQSV